jgi:hypothetical protein
MAWATAWGEDANRILCPHFGLPELPVILFPTAAPFEATAKVPAIDTFAGDHPVAWVDDQITPEARRWAGERADPTLLVEVDPALGLTREAVDGLLAWAHALRSEDASLGFPRTVAPSEED